MFNFLKSDPKKKLQKQYEQIMEKAMHSQRNGDIKEYAKLSQQADKILKEIEDLEDKANS